MREIDFAPAVAEYLQCSTETLQNLRESGYGPKYFKVDRKPLYRKCDVDAWIETQLVASTAEYKKKRGRKRKPVPIPACRSRH